MGESYLDGEILDKHECRNGRFSRNDIDSERLSCGSDALVTRGLLSWKGGGSWDGHEFQIRILGSRGEMGIIAQRRYRRNGPGRRFERKYSNGAFRMGQTRFG